MMKFAKRTDTALTIIYTVISVLLIAVFILSLISAGGLMNGAGGSLKTSSYSPDDITAGYRFIGSLFYVLAVVLSLLFAALYGMHDHEYFAEY